MVTLTHKESQPFSAGILMERINDAPKKIDYRLRELAPVSRSNLALVFYPTSVRPPHPQRSLKMPQWPPIRRAQNICHTWGQMHMLRLAAGSQPDAGSRNLYSASSFMFVQLVS